MDMMYVSTRDAGEKATASQAILKGLAADGGLFVPEQLPVLDVSLKELAGMTYQQTAYEVMKKFLTDFTEEELRHCIASAYDSKFDTEEIAPLTRADGAYYLELFHGATIAFKDMALSILPHLLVTAAKKNHVKNEIVILTATSGDTGKAALAGFADVPGTKIIVFYPRDGVSPIQKLQMVTQKGSNTSVIGIRGNFDQAQTGVKQLFSDAALAKEMDAAGFQFSSANSINIGRLVPQIVYYVYVCAKLSGQGVIKDGEKINLVVPTGNFGNILAAFYAKQMGLPIAKLICASNENRVLYDFFSTGVYDKNREFVLTNSPSMDILISSNLERLLFALTGQDDGQVKSYMAQLGRTGQYHVGEKLKDKLARVFSAGYCDDAQTKAVIGRMWKEHRYLIDPHTAVAFDVLDQYRRETGDETPTLVVSTASPFKFCDSVLDAIGVEPAGDSFQRIEQLEKAGGVSAPRPLTALRGRPERFRQAADRTDMERVVRDFLG